jgi:fibronectin type III domain protein
MIVFGVFALLVMWIGFQLGTHRHTGILRALANAKHFLRDASTFPSVQQRTVSGPSGRRHSVTLSWKASTSPIVGYNVYRRGPSGVVKLNAEPITATTYVDRTVQPGQTYFYVTKAVSARGTESTASNEVRADIPSP